MGGFQSSLGSVFGKEETYEVCKQKCIDKERKRRAKQQPQTTTQFNPAQHKFEQGKLGGGGKINRKSSKKRKLKKNKKKSLKRKK